MSIADYADAIIIRPPRRLRGRTVFSILPLAAYVAYIVSHMPTPKHSHVPANILAIAIVAALTLADGCRSWREQLRLDRSGIRIRNRFRTYRIGWTDVRCLADGASAHDNWELRFVLQDGRVRTARATNWAGKEANPQVLTAIGQAAEIHGLSADLSGIAVSYGLYADPGGEPGCRYWSGTWSPLLPAGYSGKAQPKEFPRQLASPLGTPGDWNYAAARVRQLTGLFTGFSAAGVLAVVAAAVINPRYYRPLGWFVHPPSATRSFILIFAAFMLLLSLGAWLGRKEMIGLDRAANRAAATVTRITGQ